jgi:hypothetical protein
MSGAPHGLVPDPALVGPGDVALDRLQELLQRQLALVHQGCLTAAVELLDQTDRCVQEIARDLPEAEWAVRRPGLERLYQDLSLALAAQRAEVSAALEALHGAKKTLQAYSRAPSFRR